MKTLAAKCALAVSAVVFGVGCTTHQPQSLHVGPADSLTTTGDYIPADLDDALRVLQARLSPTEVAYIRDSVTESMVSYHMTVGMGLRNGWGLWAGSRLTKYFNRVGIFHPDDMSGIILTSLWRRVHQQPLRLEEQVAYYKRYWAVMEPPRDTVFVGCPGGARRHNMTLIRADSVPGATHFGRCVATGEWWAYELDRGWFAPDSTTLARLIAQ